MSSIAQTNVSDLPESRVKIEAEVGSDEIEARIEKAAQSLGREMKLPGFRKGKIPGPVVVQKVGRPALFEDALRDSLGRWYTDIISATKIEPIGDPKIDIGEFPELGESLKLTIEVGVRPEAKLGKYKGLKVEKRKPEANEQELAGTLEQLREQHASLETVERESKNEDFVVIDYVGSVGDEKFDGGEARDQVIELGSGRLVPGFEDQLIGAKAGEDVEVNITFPEDYPSEELQGKEASFAVTIKEVKEKKLPELTDDFALDAAGFDTLEELKEDIRTKQLEGAEDEIRNEFREAAVDAAVENAEIDVPESLVKARAQEIWEQTAHSMSHQGINKATYLQITGKTEEEIVAESEPEAEKNLKREAVLAAVVVAEKIEPTDEELLKDLGGPQGGDEKADKEAQKFLKKLDKSGRLESFRRDVAMRRAVDSIVESTEPA